MPRVLDPIPVVVATFLVGVAAALVQGSPGDSSATRPVSTPAVPGASGVGPGQVTPGPGAPGPPGAPAVPGAPGAQPSGVPSLSAEPDAGLFPVPTGPGATSTAGVASSAAGPDSSGVSGSDSPAATTASALPPDQDFNTDPPSQVTSPTPSGFTSSPPDLKN